MKHEAKLYQKFKKNTPLIKWSRLESWASFGIPDLLGYNDNCGFFMVELKIQNGNKIKFSPHQILFHTTRTKRNFILVEQPPHAPRSGVKLYRSADVAALAADPGAVVPLALNDFEEIQKILIKS